MISYLGKSVVPGIAIGRIVLWKKGEEEVTRTEITDVEGELHRLQMAQERMIKQLKDLAESLRNSHSHEDATIFDAHLAIAEDPALFSTIQSTIREKHVNAEYATLVSGEHYATIFDGIEDEYMKERANDVRDISARLIHILRGRPEAVNELDENSIIVAEDLTPGETMQIDRKMVAGFVNRLGSRNSHTAILARSMNIPALIRTPFENFIDGHPAIVDALAGVLIVDPDAATIMEYEKRIEAEAQGKKLLVSLKGLPNETKSGRSVRVFANAACLADVDNAIDADAGGIGLFRSEFIYLEKDTYPTEKEQFEVYRDALLKMEGKEVVIRTLDIGADKTAPYFGLFRESNPAMGYRAIRICLTETELFKTQLRALYRASVYGNLSIMYPMITSVEEIRKIKEINAEVRKELLDRGILINRVRQGIMIETPSAVMISDLLAAETEFFSIGTNDLTQYALAIDRQNDRLMPFYNPHHESVIRMIAMTVKNAHEKGIPVTICGELAADPEMTEKLMDMGIDELSVAPSFVLPLRQLIRGLE